MINDEQRLRRCNYIGGSDVPIIMGCSKFKTPWELLLEKSQIRETDFGGNIYSHVGTVLEPRIQNALNLINVDEINYEKVYNNVPFECHIDGLNQNEDEIQEIKVANQTLNQCYLSYEWQIRTYMYVTGIKSARLILLNRNKCGDGFLKKSINYVIKYYDIDYIHNFNHISDHETIISDIDYCIEQLKLYKKDLEFMKISHDEDKEQLMLNKIEKFWEFKKLLDEDKNLHENIEFKKNFMLEFKGIK